MKFLLDLWTSCNHSYVLRARDLTLNCGNISTASNSCWIRSPSAGDWFSKLLSLFSFLKIFIIWFFVQLFLSNATFAIAPTAWKSAQRRRNWQTALKMPTVVQSYPSNTRSWVESNLNRTRKVALWKRYVAFRMQRLRHARATIMPNANLIAAIRMAVMVVVRHWRASC